VARRDEYRGHWPQLRGVSRCHSVFTQQAAGACGYTLGEDGKLTKDFSKPIRFLDPKPFLIPDSANLPYCTTTGLMFNSSAYVGPEVECSVEKHVDGWSVRGGGHATCGVACLRVEE
jgi:hypothetical protein